MLSSDFFRGTDGFFRRSARLFTKKVLFRPKSQKRLFPREWLDFGTFSERVMDFSEGEFGSFGGFVLILFWASDGNRKTENLPFNHWVLQNLQDYASVLRLQNYASYQGIQYCRLTEKFAKTGLNRMRLLTHWFWRFSKTMLPNLLLIEAYLTSLAWIPSCVMGKMRGKNVVIFLWPQRPLQIAWNWDISFIERLGHSLF